ncbi:MAG TPA: BON domain-containing protein, partial [Steroidobacteraceae bacterium]|nr:BON domain-containing protein [Steroidobacteraceae bacterium]
MQFRLTCIARPFACRPRAALFAVANDFVRSIEGAVMSLISFIADAGEKLLGTATATAAPPAGGAAPDVAQLNAAAGAAIAKYVASQNLTAQNLNITYDGASKTVTVTGVAPDQATKEKIVLCCGNVHSVAKVNDQLTVAQNPAAAS